MLFILLGEKETLFNYIFLQICKTLQSIAQKVCDFSCDPEKAHGNALDGGQNSGGGNHFLGRDHYDNHYLLKGRLRFLSREGFGD